MTSDVLLQAARRAERARILAILGSPLVEGRIDLAHHIVFYTDLPWEQALDLLAVATTTSERLPPNESEEERCARIRRVGELTGRTKAATKLCESQIPSYHAATLL